MPGGIVWEGEEGVSDRTKGPTVLKHGVCSIEEPVGEPFVVGRKEEAEESIADSFVGKEGNQLVAATDQRGASKKGFWRRV